MTTLLHASHEHHERLQPGIAQILETAELVGSVPCEDLRPQVLAARAFVSGTLLPHMEAAERAIYPALEAVLSDPQAMAPMAREHAEIRSLCAELGRICDRHASPDVPFTPGDGMAVRRILFRLHAILRIHLDEEEHYLTVLRRNLSEEETAELARDLEHATSIPL
ncbi:MAG: hemerythrin domain-containing protein [Chloroflexi bacterium]|jgi:hypothetical protein|nr:hemerythrin domain-containing protein [Chloroflexota bacterium]